MQLNKPANFTNREHSSLNREVEDNFYSVPEEVIRSIFKMSGISCLASLTLASKRFHQIVEKEIFVITQAQKVANIHFKGECHLKNIQEYYQELKVRVLYCLKKHENLNSLKAEMENLLDMDQIESWVILKKVVDLSDMLIFLDYLKIELNQPLTTYQFQTIEDFLKLEKDSLEWIQKNKTHLSQITSIELYGKNLTSIHESIGECVNLNTLDLSYNNLTSLPESIGQCINLIELNLRCNELTILSDSIRKCINLNTLDLSGNNLTSLPKWIGELKKLGKLSIDNNYLKALPNSIDDCEELNKEYLKIELKNQKQVFFY